VAYIRVEQQAHLQHASQGAGLSHHRCSNMGRRLVCGAYNGLAGQQPSQLLVVPWHAAHCTYGCVWCGRAIIK
jgi:hypothetical protein